MKLKRILDLFTHKNINNCYNKLFIVDAYTFVFMLQVIDKLADIH